MSNGPARRPVVPHERPSHPTWRAVALMAGVVVLLVVLALASAVA